MCRCLCGCRAGGAQWLHVRAGVVRWLHVWCNRRREAWRHRPGICWCGTGTGAGSMARTERAGGRRLQPPAWCCAASAPGNRRPPGRKPRPPARARAPVPARPVERLLARRGSARRRPGAGKPAEQRTAPRPLQAPGSRRRSPDSSEPAAARAFQWAALTCSTRACHWVRPRARISGRGGGAAGGADALCASARARRCPRAAGPGAGREQGAPSACAGCCVLVRLRRRRPLARRPRR